MAEFSRSLHTSDPAEARKRCLGATVWFRTTIARLRNMPSPNRTDLEDAARALFAELTQDSARTKAFHPDHFDDDIRWNIECSRDRINALDDQLRQNSFDEAIRHRASGLTASVDWTFESLGDRERLLALQLTARAEREHLHQFVEFLLRPHLSPAVADPLFGTATVPNASLRPMLVGHSQAQSGPTVREAVTDYINRQTLRNLGKSQIEELSRALMWLREVMGDATLLSAVETAALRNFRDDLARLDVGLRGRQVPFKKRLTNVTGSQVKSVTAQRYWRSIQSFFSWCVAEQHVLHDPAAGLKLEPKKGQRARTPPPFTQAELKRLLETPLYAGYKTMKRITLPGQCCRRAGHWWSGVMLLFTGLRAGEMAQLLPEDFLFDADIPHLKIREVNDLGERVKSTKNEASVRDVPIAPQLLQLGLREFVTDRAKVSSSAKVFREFRPGTKGRQSDGLTKFWSSYLHKFDLWKAGRSTHVFRHTVVACLRANDIREDDIAAFVGHFRGDITAQYGGAYPLGRKLKTVQQLDYGFDVVAALGGVYEGERHR